MLARRSVAVDDNTAPDMQRNLGTDQMRFAGKNRVRLDRRSKIFAEQGFERRFDMAAQRIADFDLLAGDRQLHGGKPLTLGGAACNVLATRPPRSPGGVENGALKRNRHGWEEGQARGFRT